MSKIEITPVSNSADMSVGINRALQQNFHYKLGYGTLFGICSEFSNKLIG